MLLPFRPGPVTALTTLTYLGLLIGLLYVHLTVPHQGQHDLSLSGVDAAETTDLAEAWRDLAALTRRYHPHNSDDNDRVRRWLLRRVGEILDSNGASYRIVSGAEAGGAPRPKLYNAAESSHETHIQAQSRSDESAAIIFDDTISNVTTVERNGNSVYFEGDNIAVYIRGSDDPEGDWWTRHARSYGKGGVLVSAHYDSVSTGFGATDAGMAVVSSLQVIRHFTSPGRPWPARGIVVLFNNDEEAGLWGARAFGNSPLLPFVTTFVNLEGAGAGGRAVMFRATDRQVSAAYALSPHPFGSVIANDAFSMGAIKSDTDYHVFAETFGQRGVDVAFYAPRSLYHTREDSTRHTSVDSIAHMLSAAIATTAEMAAADVAGRFSGPRADGDRDKAQNGRGSVGVWFDVFGCGFAVFGLRGLFAWSLALLVGTPVLLAVVTYALVQRDRYYFAARDARVRYDDVDGHVDERVDLGGWRGMFRFPLALAVVVAADVGLAVVVKTVNPLIMASSEYSVWAMFISLTYALLWALLKVADRARPSALQRGYANIWLFGFSWVLLVASTVLADRYQIASGYLFAFLHSAVFLSTLITLLDCFALPSKRAFAADTLEARQLQGDHDPPPPVPPAPSSSGADHDDHDSDPEADEHTPLRGVRASSRYGTTTFRTTIVDASQRSFAALLKDREAHKAYNGEQAWAIHLSPVTWLLQFVLLAPIVIIVFGQVGLFLVTSVAQTGPDGGSQLLPYLIAAAMSVFLLLPLTPFIHRVSYHIPAALAVVFIATLAYNLSAFPVSATSPYKFFFRQELDLDTNSSRVNITGIEEYVRLMVQDLPSAAGQDIPCEFGPTRSGLSTCSYDGASVLPIFGSHHNMTVTREGATLTIDAGDTKVCTLRFDAPVAHVRVHGTPEQPDPRFYNAPDEGIRALELNRRDRGTPWRVDVTMLKGAEGGTLAGTLVCFWDDVNEGAVPAYDEAVHYMPEWAILTKASTGLVWLKKRFELGGH